MKRSRINYRNLAYSASRGMFAVLLVIVVFGAFDFIAHSLSEEYAVPSNYFTGKFVFGTIWGWVIYFLLSRIKTSLWFRSFFFSAIISIFLQFRYFLEGYAIDFVVLFMFIHFFILWPVSYLVFKWMNKKYKK